MLIDTSSSSENIAESKRPYSNGTERSSLELSPYTTARGDTAASAPISYLDTNNDYSKQDLKRRRRVRTGCLTCRERHLKCDEAFPICDNCRKSQRDCRRGIKLKFTDIKVKQPAVMCIDKSNYLVEFVDESREIASEYENGRESYIPYDRFIYTKTRMETPQSSLAMKSLMLPSQAPLSTNNLNPATSSLGVALRPFICDRSSVYLKKRLPPISDINTARFLSVYISYIGPWIDTLSGSKVFGVILPALAKSQPVILNAISCLGASLACRTDLSIDPNIPAQLHVKASELLMKAISQLPKDLEVCLAASSCLVVYEMMINMSMAHDRHIRGIRALLKEYEFLVTSKTPPGKRAWSNSLIIDGCFWLSTTVDTLSSFLHQVDSVWKLDDYDFFYDNRPSTVLPINRSSVWWYHRLLYIIFKGLKLLKTQNTAYFRDPELVDRLRVDDSLILSEIKLLLHELNDWECNVPLPFHPFIDIPVSELDGTSLFPNIYCGNRTTALLWASYHAFLVNLKENTGISVFESQLLPTFPFLKQSSYYHALRVAGIIVHANDKILTNLTSPIISVITPVLKADEYAEIYNHTTLVETTTGWSSSQLKRTMRGGR